MKITAGTQDETKQAVGLKVILDENYLTQCIREPTRGNNILDLSITNIQNLIHSYETRSSIMNDHQIIVVRTTINSLATQNTILKQSLIYKSQSDYNFHSKTMDWDYIKAKLHQAD